jgi:hypothetical protein
MAQRTALFKPAGENLQWYADYFTTTLQDIYKTSSLSAAPLRISRGNTVSAPAYRQNTERVKYQHAWEV